jgi:hypothetical protein
MERALEEGKRADHARAQLAEARSLRGVFRAILKL